MKKLVAFVLILVCCTANAQSVYKANSDSAGYYAYGKICGSGASIPPYRLALDTLVANKDTAQLSKWLYSKRAEVQAYGVTGLYEVWLKGNYVVPEKTYKAIRKVKRSLKRINCCNGCFIDRTTLKMALVDIEIPKNSSRAIMQVNVDSIVHYAYGENCGLIAEDPPYRIKMNKAVTNTDTTTLKTWLYSSKKELNAYAVEGYFKLKSNGIVVSGSVLDKILLLQQDITPIYTCRGCPYRLMPLNMAIGKFNF